MVCQAGSRPFIMAESNKRTQFIAGIFVLCGIILLGGLILEFGPLEHRLRKPYTIHAVFSDAQSLIKGSPVRRAGAVIGRVSTSPELVEGLRGVKVSLDIYPEYQIPEKSRFKISTIGLMGDCAVDVIPPPPDEVTGKFIAANETINGVGSTDLTTVATNLTDEATEVMKDIRNGLAELNKTISRLNAEVLSDANTKNVSQAIERVNNSIGRIETQILTDENAAAVRDSLALLKNTMERASAATVKADSALAKIDKAVDQLGPGLKGFAGATAALDAASDSLNGLLKEVRSGRGILYALFNNVQLRDNFEQLVGNLRRRGVLFYKDKPAPAPASAGRPKGRQTAPAFKAGQEPWRKR